MEFGNRPTPRPIGATATASQTAIPERQGLPHSERGLLAASLHPTFVPPGFEGGRNLMSDAP